MKKLICVFILPFFTLYSSVLFSQTDSSNSFPFKKRPSTVNTVARQSLPEQDCNGAIPVCFTTYLQSQAYYGIGNVLDLPRGAGLAGCDTYAAMGAYNTVETNSVWYSFNTSSSGTLAFEITPADTIGDYDFVLYDVTNNTCKDISSNAIFPISSNYSGVGGPTGMSNLGTQPYSCLTTPKYNSNQCSVLNVLSGRSYVLMVCNWYGTTAGYTLQFNGTANIFDTIPPKIASIKPSCDNDSILLITFSEPILCDSFNIASNVLIINGPNGNTPFSSTVLADCGTACSTVQVNLTEALINNSVYSVTIQKPEKIFDKCGNQLTIVTFSDTLSILSNFTINPTASNYDACGDESVNLNVEVSPQGQYNFNWNSSQYLSDEQIQNPILTSPNQNGQIIEYVTVINKNGCMKRDSLIINTHRNPLIAVAGGSTTSICEGATTLLKATGNSSTYTWEPVVGFANGVGNSITATPTYSVIYTVTGTNTYGCTTQKTKEVIVRPKPTILFVPSDSVVCLGSTVAMATFNGYNSSWSPAIGLSTTIGDYIACAPTTTTNYTVTDSLGCKNNKTVYIEQPPIVSVNPAHCTICSDGDVTLYISANNFTSTLWSSTQPIANPTVTTITASPDVTSYYTITATNVHCQDTAIAAISVVQDVIVGITATKDIVCKGDSVFLIANGATNFKWINDNGFLSNKDTILISPVVQSNYTLTGSTSICNDTTTITIGVYNQPVVDAGIDVGIVMGTETTLNASGANTYLWEGDGLSCTTCMQPIAAPATTTIYTLTGIDINGCKDKDEVTVAIDENFEVFVPSGFTPNGDGVNDVLYFRGRGVASAHLVIFNRWGEMVFETTDMSKGWDGKMNGVQLNSAVFVYRTYGKLNDGSDFKKTGDITLIR